MKWQQLLSSKRFSDKQPPSANQTRSRFEQDFDRIIFSQPFRKLQDKTQVFPMPEDDFVHTRLTHSLEVSSVGRSLGKLAGQHLLKVYPELSANYSSHAVGHIVAAACLAHDLGNPPFGHAGEEGISAYFKHQGRHFREQVSSSEWIDLCNYEGNAQGFRILNSSLYKGLELCYATLGAFTKYPLSAHAEKIPERSSHKKFGFYQSERERFERLTRDMQLKKIGEEAWCRHPLAFLVEAADDICYSIIDLEDACRLALVPFEKVKDFLAAIIGDAFSEKKLERVAATDEKLGILRAMAISKLVNEAATVFVRHEKEMIEGSFDQPLVSEVPSADTLNAISQLSVAKIYRSKPVLEREAGGYEVIGQLMRAFSEAAVQMKFYSPSGQQKVIYRLLPEAFQLAIEQSQNTYGVLRLVTDYIGGLTDRYALRLFQIVYGR